MSDCIVYYKTLPLFKLPLSKSVYIENQMDGKVDCKLKRKTDRIESIDLGPPTKLPKLEKETAAIEKATTTTTKPWVCPASSKSSRTIKSSIMKQMIKPIIDEIKPVFQRNDKKQPISLASADGTMTHIPACPQAMKAVARAVLRKPHTTQYTHASGSLEARRAIAIHHSVPGQPPVRLEKDVIVTDGCSGALEVALGALLDPGTSLLVPRPGFPLYEEIADSLGVKVVEYDLDPDLDWECDLRHLEAIMSNPDSKSNIRAMVINNPSSHGAVFSEDHLLAVLNFASKHQLPIVSDEVYGDLTFGPHTFHPLATVTAKHGRKVPVITTSGLSKQFLVPGWRLGWAVFHDNQWGSLEQVRVGAHKLAMRRHGVSHLQQSAIRELLVPSSSSVSAKRTVAGWKKQLRATLERQSLVLYSHLVQCDGLDARWIPEGSMYALVGLDRDRLLSDIQTDVEFCRALVREENVFCLPGTSFGAPGTIRVTFACPEFTLEEAAQRIVRFCQRHTITEHETRVVGGTLKNNESE